MKFVLIYFHVSKFFATPYVTIVDKKKVDSSSSYMILIFLYECDARTNKNTSMNRRVDIQDIQK